MRYRSLLCGLLGLMSSQALFAKEGSLADYQPGWYLGLQCGFSWLDDGNATANFMDRVYTYSNFNSKARFSEKKHLSGGLLVGYSFTPYFSLEAAATLVSEEKEGVTLKNTSYYVSYETALLIYMGGKGTLPLEVISQTLQGWHLFCTIGPSLMSKGNDKFHYDSDSDGYITVENSNKNSALKLGLYYALGIGYDFTDQLSMNLSYTELRSFHKSRHVISENSEVLEVGIPSRKIVAVGITYKF